jgi:hypothetical protein
VIPAVVAVALLIGGGIFAAVNVPQHHDNTPTSSAPTTTAAPNTGPFTGTYTANFAPRTDLDGKQVQGETSATATWAVRSVCRSGVCVATASRRSGLTTSVSTLVFDDVGGRWLAVGLGSETCNNATAETWGVFRLQPHPDGTIAGEYSVTTSNGCADKRTVTFTRTGDVDINSLPDPANHAPRVVSPAEALHGRYHQTQTFAAGTKNEYDYLVRTDCLRTGDRCMSYFHIEGSGIPLVFSGGKWTWDRDIDDKCPGGDPEHVKVTAEYPLPTPSQDPITLLTGDGRQVQTGSCAGSFDFNQQFARAGD